MIKERFVTVISLISITLVAVILIASTAVLKKDEDVTSTRISQPDYVSKIFNKDIVSEIDIKIDENSWKDLLENALKEEYYNCDIIINGETFSNVGIRAKGNSSLTMVANDSTTDRYSFKINFGKYIKGQSYYGLDKLALNNNISDATNMKEYLSYEIFNEMGVATPGFAYTSIKINGEPWGLYLAVEVMEESFIERYFGTIDGNLYKPEGMEMGARGMDMEKPNMKNVKVPMEENPRDMDIEKNENGNPKNFGGFGRGNSGTNLVYTGDDISNYSGIFDNAIFKTTSKKDYNTVVNMMKSLNAGTNLEEYLDVDEILRYFAVNTFLVNLDSYAGSLKHNYYLYEKDSKFQILPWDFNLSFAGHEVKDGASAINFPIDNPVSDTMENSPLISKLLEKDEYKKIYHEYLEELVVKYIKSGKYKASISKVNELIKEYVKNDPTGFFTYEQYEKSLPILLQFGKDRAESIIAQLNGQQSSTTYGNIATTMDLSALGTMGRGFGGNMPAMNQGERPNMFGNIEDRENMMKVMEVIGNFSGDELTEEERGKLRELGLNDTQIEEMINMRNGMPSGNKGINPSNNNSKPDDNKNRMPQRVDMTQSGMVQQNKNILIATGICVLSLIFALIYVSKFKRRKYITCKPPY
ncbi:CotH kinase family protein [Tissierella praeacuta]|uniref:CotH kinase family protein n=1 Tax=Tissierella praeacuta TaxID=43131 RepID=UPI00333F6E56